MVRLHASLQSIHPRAKEAEIQGLLARDEREHPEGRGWSFWDIFKCLCVVYVTLLVFGVKVSKAESTNPSTCAAFWAAPSSAHICTVNISKTDVGSWLGSRFRLVSSPCPIEENPLVDITLLGSHWTWQDIAGLCPQLMVWFAGVDATRVPEEGPLGFCNGYKLFKDVEITLNDWTRIHVSKCYANAYCGKLCPDAPKELECLNKCLQKVGQDQHASFVKACTSPGSTKDWVRDWAGEWVKDEL